MSRWDDVRAEAPDLAKAAEQVFDARRHKVLATLRADGSPRVSGIEATFEGGDLWLGGTWQSVKCRDLLRDPRLALHSGTEDPPEDPDPGYVFDAKVAGRAVAVTDVDVLARFAEGAPPGPMHLFRVDVSEVVVIRLGEPADHLVLDSWQLGAGVRRAERR